MTEHVLITGGDGYVGRHAARSYLTETEARVTLLVRARDLEHARAKREAMAAWLRGCDPRRVSYVHGDLTAGDLLRGAERKTITAIVHGAAVTRFNVERELARAVNVEGARKVLEFAGRCPRLEVFGLLSTVYSCGLVAGDIPELPATGDAGFANHYEWSKCAAEDEALAAYSHLPLHIIRIATLFADDDAGNVTQFNAFHNTLKLYFYGLLSLVPGKLDTPVYLVTGDFVARAVFRLMRSKRARGIYHVAHERPYNPTLGELIALTFDVFEQDEGFQRKRILRPLFTDYESFELLADSVESFASPVTRQALQSMTPFARQMYSCKAVANTRLRHELADYEPPDHRVQLANTVRRLIETKWGRNAPSSASGGQVERSMGHAV